MDHVYESLESWLNIYRDIFLDDWKTGKANGKYHKYSDSPCYQDYAAIVKALNCLAPAAGYDRIRIKDDLWGRRFLK